MNIEGRRVVVTGGTRGVGYAIAKALLDRGAKVHISSRRLEDVKSAVESLQGGTAIAGAACDVRSYESVKELFGWVDSEFGGLDILINNAGILARSGVAEMRPEEWDAIIGTNLTGVFYCCRQAIPLMKRSGGGYIINIGSLAGRNPIAGAAAYCASKFGLVGFSESLMQEVRYDHIRVSCVMPGSINTGFSGTVEEDHEAVWKLSPEDVSQVIVDLIEMDARALASVVELRPSEPRRSK